MKKILGSIVITAFILSIVGSASPQINSTIKSLIGTKTYASTSLPLPPSMNVVINLAEKSEK